MVSRIPRRVALLALLALLGCGKTENKRPLASFLVTPARPVMGQAVLFDASGSSDPDGRVTEYAFEFGEGGEHWSRSLNPTREHVFQETGVFWVKLQVTDNRGARAEAVRPVEVGLGNPEGEGLAEVSPEPEPDLEPDADAGEPDADAGEPDTLEAEPQGGEEGEAQTDGEDELRPFSGHVSVAEFVGKTRDWAYVYAGFSRPIEQSCGSTHEVIEFEHCRVTLIRPDDPGTECLPSPSTAGGTITIHGALVDPVLLVPSEDDEGRWSYSDNLGDDLERLFAAAAQLHIEVAGDASEGVPGAAGALLTPPDFQVTEPALKDPDLSFTIGQPIAIGWDGAIDDGVERMSIVLTAAEEDRSLSYNCICTPPDNGGFEIPGDVTALLPPGAPNASLMLTRGEHATLYSEDDGRIMATSTIYRGGSGTLQ